MFTSFLIERFEEHPETSAVISPAGRCTFGELADLSRCWGERLEQMDVAAGTVVGLDGDFSPNTIALFLALLDRATIIVPQGNVGRAGHEVKEEIAQVEVRFHVDGGDEVQFEQIDRSANHVLYDELRGRRHPGVVAFSSGTSGEPKAAVHDFTLLLEKFEARRSALSTLAFLLFEHLGGIRTMLHALSNTTTIVATRDRSPEGVCELIEEHRVELLPATPSFFNLLLLSGAHRRHDLSSLRVISYGAEPMPQGTLDRLRRAFPDVKLQQTYGLIEIGPLSSKSRDDGSLWIKVGGEGFETRVVDGVLQVRSRATTMGYLNAPTPITPDGWFITGDVVREEGEYLQFLGRQTETINVGGEKVFPTEVEDVIQSMPGVLEATVYGERNGLIGQIVCAEVRTLETTDQARFAAEVKRYCRERLERFKVPVKVRLTEERQFGERFKKVRRQGGQ